MDFEVSTNVETLAQDECKACSVDKEGLSEFLTKGPTESGFKSFNINGKAQAEVDRGK